MNSEPGDDLIGQSKARQEEAVTTPPGLLARLWAVVPGIGRAIYSIWAPERTPDGFALSRPPRDSRNALYSPDRRRRYASPGQQAAMGWAVLYPLVTISTLVLTAHLIAGGKSKTLDMSARGDLLIALAFPVVVLGTIFCVWKAFTIGLEINGQIYDVEETPEEFNPLDELNLKTRGILGNLDL